MSDCCASGRMRSTRSSPPPSALVRSPTRRVRARGAASGDGASIAVIESAKDARAALTHVRKSMETAARVLRAEDLTDPAGWRTHRFAQWPDKLAFEVAADGADAGFRCSSRTRRKSSSLRFEAERDEGVLERIEKVFRREAVSGSILQRVLAQTMEAFGPRFDGARRAVTAATSELVTRCPELMGARFASGVPFCGAATSAWLGSAGAGTSGGGDGGLGSARTSADDSASAERVDDACERARSALAKDGLRGALGVFQESLASPSDLRTRFHLRLALAQTCVDERPASHSVYRTSPNCARTSLVAR